MPSSGSHVGSAVTWRERVGIEARSALGAGEAGRADHQRRVVYQRPLRRQQACSSRTAAHDCIIATNARDSRALNACSTSPRLDGRAGRRRLQPGVGRPPAPAHRRPARGAPGRTPGGDLRPAARVPVRRAGEHDRDAATRTTTCARVPVYSLYSETREPTAEMLRGLDVLVIDLQDVGTRIYTYIYTMANCLTAARAARRARSIVCDRPNPIGGVAVEGPMLVPGLRVVRRACIPIPMRHGMTIGELARLFNEHFGIGAELEVVADGGLAARHVLRRRPALPWVHAVAEHPDARHARSCIRARVLFEGHERLGRARHDAAVRAGRRAVGRSPSDSRTRMNRRELPGVFFRPALFEPTFHKHAGKALRRLPDPRARSADVPAGRNRRRADRSVPSRGSGSVPLARSAVRVRARQAADRHPGGIVRSCASRSTPACRHARSRGRGSRTWPRF